MTAAAAGTRRACSAASCGSRAYPRTDPVAIVLLQSSDGGAVLLARGARGPRRLMTCISGFVEQAEGLEDAVRRGAGGGARGARAAAATV